MMTTVFFDFETGGVQEIHPNIQLAAIAVDGEWNELSIFERKIQFDELLAQPEALKINHYDPEVWAREAKPEAVVAREFAAWLRPFCCVEKMGRRGVPYSVARLAGHNAATFDGPRLRAMFERSQAFLPCELFVRDTLQRALWYFDERGQQPASLRLTELAKSFGLPEDGAHDALTDVRLSIAIAKSMKESAVAA